MNVIGALLLIVLIILSSGRAGTETSEAGGVREITVKLSNFKISPSTIEVNKGDTVKLKVEILEGKHNLYIEGCDLGTEISEAKATQIIEFTADSAGEFATWCEVRDHRAKGMEGRLVVN